MTSKKDEQDPQNQVPTMIVALPIEYREATIEGVFNHEIGTHYLRKYNDRKQIWY
jgi:hypothetical protein